MPNHFSRADLCRAGAILAEQLGGRWRHSGAMCRCPAHPDRTPSLSIRLGDRGLLFKCFAGCDTIDVFRALRRQRLAVPASIEGGDNRFEPADIARMAGNARRIWDASLPIAGTPGETYLACRGLTLPVHGLRFHPATPLGPAGRARFRPAIIAAIQQSDRVIAIQRLFLGQSGCLASDLERAKLALGRPLNGAVQLAPAGIDLGLAEGIESALAAMQLLGIPVWATLGSERLAQIAIPRSVRRLLLLPDADRSGRLGEAKARLAYARRDCRIITQWPWRGHKDWNDVLTEEGERETRLVRHAV
jgi:putative DNA primase/helicase